MRVTVFRLLYLGVVLGFAAVWLYVFIYVQLYGSFLVYCPFGELPFEVGLVLVLLVGGVYLLYADFKTV